MPLNVSDSMIAPPHSYVSSLPFRPRVNTPQPPPIPMPLPLAASHRAYMPYQPLLSQLRPTASQRGSSAGNHRRPQERRLPPPPPTDLPLIPVASAASSLFTPALRSVHSSAGSSVAFTLKTLWLARRKNVSRFTQNNCLHNKVFHPAD